MSDVGTWANNVAYQIQGFLNWGDIAASIRNTWYGLDDVIAWWWDQVNWFIMRANNWWLSVKVHVQYWIDLAQDEVLVITDQLQAWFTQLQADVQHLLDQVPTLDEIINWFTFRYADMLDWFRGIGGLVTQEIMELVNQMLIMWLPFYNDFVSLWNDIQLFFADPLEWLYIKMDEWFDRFW
jgi:hypothetical protein